MARRAERFLVFVYPYKHKITIRKYKDNCYWLVKKKRWKQIKEKSRKSYLVFKNLTHGGVKKIVNEYDGYTVRVLY